MEQIRMICQHPLCPCPGVCCQDCLEQRGCAATCERVLYKDAIYRSNSFLVGQMEELADLSGHWLIRVAAQRLKSLDLALTDGAKVPGLNEGSQARGLAAAPVRDLAVV